jgi:hypothetical protein
MSAFNTNGPRLPQELWYSILEIYYEGVGPKAAADVVPLMVCKDWCVSSFIDSLAVKVRLVADDVALNNFHVGYSATSSLPTS